jgi:hypothetical protein
MLVSVEPAHEPALQTALVIAAERYPSDTRVLISYPRRRQEALLAPSNSDVTAMPVRFRIARRQVEFLKALLTLIG